MKTATHHKEIRRGFSLVEVSISTLLVGLLVITSLQSVSNTYQTGHDSVQRIEGSLLAENLLEEILQADYADRNNPVFGIEPNESADSRATFDDVDDYNGWFASPPTDQEGENVKGPDWARSVIIKHVDPIELTTNTGNEDRGVKKIHVSVTYKGDIVAELMGVQTRAWISMIPDASDLKTTGQAPPTNLPPTANLSASVVTGTSPLTVDFDASSSTDPENAPLEYSWDYGSGDIHEGGTTRNTFINESADARVYVVTLTVRDIHGATDSQQVSITVYSP